MDVNDCKVWKLKKVLAHHFHIFLAQTKLRNAMHCQQQQSDTN